MLQKKRLYGTGLHLRPGPWVLFVNGHDHDFLRTEEGICQKLILLALVQVTSLTFQLIYFLTVALVAALCLGLTCVYCEGSNAC